MAYYRFTRLQQYINGQPTDVYSKGERVDDVDYDTYDGCMDGTTNTRWIPVSQTVCYNGDLWSMEKEQISYDEGAAWTDTGNTRRASVIEQSSSQCSGANNDWRVVYGEYICNGTTKCVKEAEYVNDSPTGRTRAGSMVELLSEDCGVMHQWVDVPGEFLCVYKCGRADKYTKQKQQYSIDGGLHWEDTGETREGDFIEKNSADCGCDTSITRWITVSGEYVCAGTSKYTKEKEQTSTDGTNWTDTGNTRAGSLIEASSSSCASIRWVTVQDEYSCVGYNKYNLEKEQQSMDGGTTWTDTGNTRAGSTLIEANSTDCGYDPHDYSTEYLTTEALGSGDISLKKGGESTNQGTLSSIQYSKNGGAWTSYAYDYSITVVSGDKIRWKAEKGGINSTEWYSYFAATADYKVYGNPLSLLKNDGFIDVPDFIYENAYCRLFYNSSTLKDASNLALPATTLATNCYVYMFSGCTSLTTAPALPATTLAKACYQGMFYKCTSLTTAPELPATTLAKGCYYSMFSGCTSLTTAPSLPATTLAESCYENMFEGCTSLTTAPALPATTLADICYWGMFSRCTSLTTAPALPATTLMPYCYYSMFSGCTSLTTAPSELPATTLAINCYYSMFQGCTSLTTAPALPATTLATNCYVYMFLDCTSLTTAPVLPATTLAVDCYSEMFQGCTSLTTAPSLPAKTLASSCYSSMFQGCTSLTTAPALPATTLAENCYQHMFSGCTGLTSVPSNLLPATTLASSCYWGMFQGCTSLTTAPALPATTLSNYCYEGMFSGCTSLTTAPALPATTLVYSCYDGMFQNCTSLTTAPALPATTLADICYGGMFKGCTSLTTAPSLPATTLAYRCYMNMFTSCSSLTTAPALPATTLARECYKSMFQDCNKLNSVTCCATDISASDCTDYWLWNVASTGTFVKASSMSSWTTGENGIPSGWTVQDAS